MMRLPSGEDSKSLESRTTGFIRVAGTMNLRAPSNSVVSVPVTGPACGSDALVEGLRVGVPGNLQVANTLVDATKTTFAVQVANHTTKDVWLKPRTRLGTICAAARASKGEQLQFEVRSHEVIVSCPLRAECQEATINGTGRPANYQERQELSTGVTLDFPGTAAEREETRRMFAGYADVFAKDGEGLGCKPTVQHRITTADDIPVAQRHRRIAPNQLSEVKKHLQELVEKGVIKTSQSDYASPIVLVRKKSGALRMCVDYRQLNLKTRQDAYPLPTLLTDMERSIE